MTTLPDQPAVPDTRPRPTWDAPGSWYRLGYFPAHDLSGVLMADWRHLGGQIVHMPEAIEAGHAPILNESRGAIAQPCENTRNSGCSVNPTPVPD